ncbi:MAG: hypothetical protein MJ057_07055 [Sphaerochaetaceae bacterium]|nr:hypothetical protein [Sphaerochaetaceae bacterium]
MSRYEEILKGLEEAIEFEKGNVKPSRISKLSIASIPDYSPQDIKEIRNRTGLSQSSFAMCMGVTKKAVEAWEGGRSTPDGAARRTLGLVSEKPDFFEVNGIHQSSYYSDCVSEKVEEYGSHKPDLKQKKNRLLEEVEVLEQKMEDSEPVDFSQLRKLIMAL